MKKLSLTLIAGLIFISPQIFAQIIQSAPQGNLIWFSPETASIENGFVSRKGAADKEFRKIGETTIPSSADEIEKRNIRWQEDFPHLAPLSTQEKQELLEMARNKSVPKTTSLKYHPVAMGIMGQVWYDKQTSRGIKLSYRISAGGADKIIEASGWPAAVKLPKAVSAEANEFPDRIHIKWEMKGEANAEGFRIYRRTALKGNFMIQNVDGGYSQIDKTWYLLITDTMVEPFAMYEYKAAAIDRLGNEGAISDVFRARTRGENVLPYFSEIKGTSNDAGSIILKWKLMMPQLARSINIYRSRYFDKEFILVGRASVGDSIYTDGTIEPNENQYYKLEVLMDEGSRNSAIVSVLGRSNEKANAPRITSVTSEKDSVTITWLPDPSSVYGYYVYQQHSIGDSVTQVSHMIPPDSGRFVHKAETNGNNFTFYYSVSSVGLDYKVSAHSMPLEIMIRGMSKLDPPTGLKVIRREGSAIITWKEQFSQNEAVMGYSIYRKAEWEKEFVKINKDTLNPALGYFADENIFQNSAYLYRVEVKDYYGGIAAMEVQLLAHPITLMAPQQLVISRTTTGVFLRWEQTTQQIKSIRLYVSEGNQKAKMIAELKPGDTTYEDKTAMKGKTLNYFIRYVSSMGTESEPGVVRSIVVR